MVLSLMVLVVIIPVKTSNRRPLALTSVYEQLIIKFLSKCVFNYEVYLFTYNYTFIIHIMQTTEQFLYWLYYCIVYILL